MSADGLDVAGGAGGTEAELDDLDAAGQALARAGLRLAALAARLGAVLADPALAVGAARVPSAYLAVQGAGLSALLGPHGLGPAGAGLLVLGTAVRAAVATYRGVEAAVAGWVRGLEAEFGRLLGASVSPVAVPLLAIGLPALTVVAARAPVPVAGPGCVPAPSGAGGPSAVAAAWRVSAGHAELVQHLIGATPGLFGGIVAGARSPGPPTGPRPGPAVLLLGEAALLRVAAGVSGARPEVPRAAAAIAGVGALSPTLHEPGLVRVTPVGRPVPAAVPRGVTDLVGGLQQASQDSDWCGPGLVRNPPQARIRVQRLDGPAGRSWIVSVPGTRDWSPVAGPNPLDLTGNVRGLAAEPTAARSAVLAAMTRAGVRPGEPVLLAGHSQGGLVAAGLAADPQVRRRFTVTHVLSVGAPIAHAAVPEQVRVLALEHADDLVPGLDGAANPAGPGWVTVSREAGGGAEAREAARSTPVATHTLSVYRRTAELVDASGDASLVDWRHGAAAFLDGRATGSTVLELQAERVRP